MSSSRETFEPVRKFGIVILKKTKNMNIACIPYHDWRKIESEGSRTRDSHIISHLRKNSDVDNLIIVNRPISYLELWLLKRRQKIQGQKVFSWGRATLYRLSSKVYVFDYVSKDIIGPVAKRKNWFFDEFGKTDFLECFKSCLKYLQIEIDAILTQNIFSRSFVKNLELPTVFDAWDNFLLFPENKKYETAFYNAYSDLANTADVWITNAIKNVIYYKENYQPKQCLLIKNGVDIERFRRSYKKPQEIEEISSPIIGFGGKITHLFDYKLFNYLVSANPLKSFVIVGQILDQSVFKNISKAKNLFYLGDKKYDEYCSYVTNFDVGIIPYVSNNLEHGADTIKMYEYLASGLNVVGTPGAGMSDMSDYIYISSTPGEFSDNIDRALVETNKITLPHFHTWDYKTKQITEILKQLSNG